MLYRPDMLSWMHAHTHTHTHRTDTAHNVIETINCVIRSDTSTEYFTDQTWCYIHQTQSIYISDNTVLY